MESKVAAKVGIDDGEMLLAAFVSRINGFHTPIKSKDEIIKVQTQAQSIRSSYLFIKLVELKISAFLLRIVTCIKYIKNVFINLRKKREVAVLSGQFFVERRKYNCIFLLAYF